MLNVIALIFAGILVAGVAVALGNSNMAPVSVSRRPSSRSWRPTIGTAPKARYPTTSSRRPAWSARPGALSNSQAERGLATRRRSRRCIRCRGRSSRNRRKLLRAISWSCRPTVRLSRPVYGLTRPASWAESP